MCGTVTCLKAENIPSWESHFFTILSRKTFLTGTPDTAHTPQINFIIFPQNHLGKGHYFPHSHSSQKSLPLSMHYPQPSQPPPHQPPCPNFCQALITFTGRPETSSGPAAPLAPPGRASHAALIPKLVPPLCLEPFLCSHCSQVKLLDMASKSLSNRS